MMKISLIIKNHRKAIGIILLSFLLFVVNALVFSFIYQDRPEQLLNPLHKESTQIVVFAAVFLGPLLETFLFQALLINFCLRLFPQKKPLNTLLAMSVSATAFSLAHGYSNAYQFAVVCPGLVFAYQYLYFMQAYSKRTAFYTVAAFHACINCCVVLFKS